MSLTSLSASFADTYVNAPASSTLAKSNGAAGAAADLAKAAGRDSGSGGAVVGAGDNLKALADYIPSEILTLYIAAVATVVNWKFPVAADRNVYLGWIFFVSLGATPIWVFFGVLLQSSVRPNWKAFAWPMVAAPLAFLAYAYAIPDSWLASSRPNGGLFATLLLLISPILLHAITLVYTKLLPP